MNISMNFFTWLHLKEMFRHFVYYKIWSLVTIIILLARISKLTEQKWIMEKCVIWRDEDGMVRSSCRAYWSWMESYHNLKTSSAKIWFSNFFQVGRNPVFFVSFHANSPLFLNKQKIISFFVLTSGLFILQALAYFYHRVRI